MRRKIAGDGLTPIVFAWPSLKDRLCWFAGFRSMQGEKANHASVRFLFYHHGRRKLHPSDGLLKEKPGFEEELKMDEPNRNCAHF
jgi:hypothetical protein